MKILVVSDNHKDERILAEIVNIHQDVDMYLHAGDSEQAEYELSPFISVKGNNDYLVENYFRIISIGSMKIYLTHGHKELTNNSLIGNAKKFDCKIVIHGHTHKSAFYKKEGVYVLCPGALRFPRGGENRRYAILKLDEKNSNVNVEFFDY